MSALGNTELLLCIVLPIITVWVHEVEGAACVIIGIFPSG